jgi:hypothetical protein
MYSGLPRLGNETLPCEESPYLAQRHACLNRQPRPVADGAGRVVLFGLYRTRPADRFLTQTPELNGAALLVHVDHLRERTQSTHSRG